jgi:hypothetical protein
VTFGGGAAATPLVVTADSIRVLVPFSAPGPLTITGVVPTFIAGLEGTLPSTQSVHQTGDYWAADASWQTAPDITPILPPKGQSSFMISTQGTSNAAVCPEGVIFGGPGPCMMFRFTLPDTASYTFTTDWEGGATTPDIDIYVCPDSTVANFHSTCNLLGPPAGALPEDGGNGATTAKPQTTGPNHQFVAGTHWFVIENSSGQPTTNFRITITRL